MNRMSKNPAVFYKRVLQASDGSKPTRAFIGLATKARIPQKECLTE